jgi:hypothetical protein
MADDLTKKTATKVSFSRLMGEGVRVQYRLDASLSEDKAAEALTRSVCTSSQNQALFVFFWNSFLGYSLGK